MKRIMLFTVILVHSLILSNAMDVHAFDMDMIDIHGFFSQGFLYSTENDLYSTKSTDGTFSFTEGGLNCSAQVSESLRVAMQLYARDLGDEGNFNLVLDWAMGEYRWQDWLGVRAGKIKEPVGFFNHVRDVDMARNPIFLPQSTYSESLRDLVNAFVGVELFGNIALGEFGDMEYEIYGGTNDIDDKYVVRRFIKQGLQTGAEKAVENTTGASYPNSTLEDLTTNQPYTIGAVISWNTALEGFRIGGSFGRYEATFSSIGTIGYLMPNPSNAMLNMPVANIVRTETQRDEPYLLSASAEYAWQKLRVVGEFMTIKTSMESITSGLAGPIFLAKNTFTSEERAVGYYGQVIYRLVDWLEMGVYYSTLYPNNDDRDGRALAAEGKARHGAWSKDICVTARFDITPFWLLKLEGHIIDGSAFLTSDEDPARIWQVFAVRTSFFF